MVMLNSKDRSRRHGLRGMVFAATLALAGQTVSAAEIHLDAPAPTPPVEVAKFEPIAPDSAKGLTLGFTQLILGVPFTDALQRGMEKASETAGFKLVTCDSKMDAATALACVRQFKTQNVDGLVTFQADAAAAANICAEGPKVPVIAIDIEQKPCETAFVGAANSYAGEIVGHELGMYFAKNFNCEYDAFVSLESTAVGVVNDQRMGGIRKAFEAVCGPVQNLRIIDTGAGGQADAAQRQVTDTLTALPGAAKVITVGINEDVITAALAAARTQGRTQDLYLGVQNFDPDNCQIWTAPHFIATAAYFPERYADLIVPNLVKAIKGEKINNQILVPHELITPENIAKVYPEYACK
ncbi:sugar ABC transporter substrate-binding protein [Rhizobium cauense]|uniref:sugar ABC transporter substrate-binding protein n=1 Tax=Rhizobium cauense TaxID=1166683 RepID=UPI001C6DFC67|nr:sugar ABC transporter substrate-binding protein [Rhizobium cauense]MBW9116544.1 sugar ABC transporter substrate-binding protein [Rhizobium cauense]